MEETADEKAAKREKKRNFVILEIIDTEKTYLSRLEAVKEVFIDPIRQKTILDEPDVMGQFGYWEVMCGIHRELLGDMELAKAEQRLNEIGKVFLKFSHYFKVYKDYLVNYENALTRRAVLMTSNKTFMSLVEAAQSNPRCFGLGIESLLIGPVQRIPRYRLLLQELLKYTSESHEEYKVITMSLAKIMEVASENNEAIRARENKEQIMDIMMQIDSRTRINLLDIPGRSLMREGPLHRQCRKDVKEFHFWLFNDKLLYGEIIPGLGKYWLHRQILLSSCRVGGADGRKVERGECAITIESPAKSFVVWAKSVEDRDAWMADIQKAMEKLREQYLVDTGKIAPLWAPDASSSHCTICSTPFGLFNRRHHCRSCGAVVCDQCSSNRVLLKHVNANAPVRVCDNCFLSQLPENMLSPGNSHRSLWRTFRGPSPASAKSPVADKTSGAAPVNPIRTKASPSVGAHHNIENPGKLATMAEEDDSEEEYDEEFNDKRAELGPDGEMVIISCSRNTVLNVDEIQKELDEVREMPTGTNAIVDTPAGGWSTRRRTTRARTGLPVKPKWAVDDDDTNKANIDNEQSGTTGMIASDDPPSSKKSDESGDLQRIEESSEQENACNRESAAAGGPKMVSNVPFSSAAAVSRDTENDDATTPAEGGEVTGQGPAKPPRRMSLFGKNRRSSVKCPPPKGPINLHITNTVVPAGDSQPGQNEEAREEESTSKGEEAVDLTAQQTAAAPNRPPIPPKKKPAAAAMSAAETITKEDRKESVATAPPPAPLQVTPTVEAATVTAAAAVASPDIADPPAKPERTRIIRG